MKQRFRYPIIAGSLISAMATGGFYFAGTLLFDGPSTLRGVFQPLVLVSLPGVLIGMLLSGGFHGNLHAGGELWEVAAIAFLVNAVLYTGAIAILSALIRRFRAKGGSN